MGGLKTPVKLLKTEDGNEALQKRRLHVLTYPGTISLHKGGENAAGRLDRRHRRQKIVERGGKERIVRQPVVQRIDRALQAGNAAIKAMQLYPCLPRKRR